MVEQNITTEDKHETHLVAMIFAALLFVAASFFPNISTRIQAAATVRADEAAPCSLATVAGNRGATLTGTLILPTGPVPVAAVIRATLYADGTLTGAETRNVGGDYAKEAVSRTWAVNANCMGTITVMRLDRTSVVAIVFDVNSKEVRKGAKVSNAARRHSVTGGRNG